MSINISLIFLFLNLGGGEIMLVLLVVLLFFGSKSIPDLARGLGRSLREIREATDNIKREIENGVNGKTEYKNTKNTFKEDENEINDIISTSQKSKPLDQQAE